MSYTWNIRSYIERNLPIKRRQEKFIAWLYSLLSPLEYLAGDYFVLKRNIDFKTKYNSQQKVLESLLNQLFDSTLNRITVDTYSDAYAPQFMYYKTEGTNPKFQYFRTESVPADYIRFRAESVNLRLFNVNVPSALSTEEVAIKSWLDTLKLAGTRYEIVYF